MIGIGLRGQESPALGGARSQGKGRKSKHRSPRVSPRSRFPLAAERPLYSELINTRHAHDVHPHSTSPLEASPFGLPPSVRRGPPILSVLPPLAFRWLGNGCGARPPLLAFFGRGPAAVSPSLPAPVDSASGDPMPNSSGEGGGIGSPRRPSPGGGASSLRSRTRARSRGLSRVRFLAPRPWM